LALSRPPERPVDAEAPRSTAARNLKKHKLRKFKMNRITVVLTMLAAPCAARTTVPGQPTVPLGSYQIPRALFVTCCGAAIRFCGRIGH
jgi:hypothetical protein